MTPLGLAEVAARKEAWRTEPPPQPGLRRAALRPLPYPFFGYFTIASDCDNARMEALINAGRIVRERYALPIADSYFPKWLYANGQKKGAARDGQRYAVPRFDERQFLETNFEWLRAFHSGGMDTVHGWIPRMMIKIAPDFELGFAKPWRDMIDGARVAKRPSLLERLLRRGLAQAPRRRRVTFAKPRTWQQYESPRYLVFKLRLPIADSRIEIAILDGERELARIDSRDLPQAKTLGLAPYIVDLWPLIGDDPALLHRIACEFVLTGPGEGWAELRQPTLLSDSRADIRRHKDCLERFNVRSAVYTSHGGGYDIGRQSSPDPLAADPRIVAEDPANPHYAMDLFHDFGLRFFNTAGNISSQRAKPIDALLFETALNDGRVVYDFHKFLQLAETPGDAAVPALFTLAGKPENPSFADFIGRQIGMALAQIDKPGLGAVLYTHNIVKSRQGPSHGDDSEAALFNAETHAALAELANRYYGLSGDLPPEHRVLVAPTASLLRLSQVTAQAADHIWYDAAENRVYLRSWQDPVTGERLPLRPEEPRELRGLTLYVEDSHSAEVLLDGRPVEALVRNPADESGRESISFADLSTPRVLLGRVPPGERPGLIADGHGIRLDHRDPCHVFHLERNSGAIMLAPRGLSLTHHQALAFAFRKSDPGVTFRIEMESENGLALALCEEGFSDVEGAYKLRSWCEATRRLVVLPFHFLLDALPTDARRLPTGAIARVKLMLEGPLQADFALEFLHLLRDSETPRSGSHLIGGKLATRQDIERIELRQGEQRMATEPLACGGYVLPLQVPHGSIVTLEGRTESGESVAPLAGRQVEVLTDMLDLDF